MFIKLIRLCVTHAPIAWSMLYGIAGQAIGVDDWDKSVKAPPNHAVLSNTLNGWYFVPKESKEMYDETLRRLESLQTNVDSGRMKANEAKAALTELTSQLTVLRASLESSRIHVAGAEIHEQTETTEFEMGPEKRLAITANHVRIVGWEGKKIKVELKKMVLSSDDKPVEDHLKAIRIVHQHGPVKFAGQSDAKWEAKEAEFLAKEGAKLSEEQLAERREFVNEIRQSSAHHRDLLDKDIDHVSVVGLEYNNNKSVTKSVKSDGGDGQMGSVRQRYAELTVYVPSCTSLCIRGARRGLQVENVTVSSLTIVDEDSTDSDARGKFALNGLQGNLLCINFPLERIRNVKGHVSVESTTEFGIEGAGTSHHDDLRDMTPSRPFQVEVHDVTEGVDMRFARVQLDLANIQGTINVENEFGDTHFTAAAALADSAHRIVSLAGRIDVELSPEAWNSVPVLAVTNHGGVRSNISREEFDDFHLTGPDKRDKVRRDWSGFRKVAAGEDRMAVFNLFDRFAAILNDKTRTNGLDLITRSGALVVVRK